MEFEGKRVLVTGAGKGIGRAVVEKLVAERAEVIALSRTKSDLDELEKAFGVATIHCDLADPAETKKAALAALPVDYLVNNAGTTALESFLETSVETFDWLMGVNARAPMILGQECARDMIRRGWKGAIVNVSSMAAFQGLADHVGYCATKGALDAITRVMATELGPYGIRTNSVNPVVTLTPMAIKAWSDPDKANAMLSRIPLGRFVEPGEVADTILYLLSPRASMITGSSVMVDGGFHSK
jgi:NAD(P)-dependent dehydrogenase (short-subunit alcohol dehydrogenase family)